MSNFSTSLEQFEDICFVHVRGEIDLDTEREFRAVFRFGRGEFVVDCTELDFIDGRGLDVLVDASIVHGQIGLWKAPPLLRRMVQLAGLEPLFAFAG
jgi:anti-anti-sigma factor